MMFPARNLHLWGIFHGYVSHNQMVIMFDIIIGPIFDGNKLGYFSLTWTKQTPSHISSYIWLVTYFDISQTAPIMQNIHVLSVNLRCCILHVCGLSDIRWTHGNTKKTCPGTTTQIAPLSESPETQSSESYGIFYDQSIHGDFQWGYGAPLRCKKCSQCLDWNLGWKEYMDHLHRKLWGRSLKNQGIRPIWFLEAYHLVGGRLSDDYPLPQKMRKPNVRSMYPLVN
jgi:hypothetical protein